MGRPKTKTRWPGTRCVRDRNGEPKYYYVRPLDGGAEIRIGAEYGTPGWEREYLAARGGTAPIVKRLTRKAGMGASAASMTMAEAVELFLRAPAFQSYAAATRRHRKQCLGHLAVQCPDAILGDLTKAHFGRLFADFTPHIHRQHVDAIRMLFKFFHLEDPTRGYECPKPVKSKGYHAWKYDHIVAFRDRWPLGSLERTIFELAYGTTQRASDLRRMRWGDIIEVINNGQTYRAIHVLAQQKTGTTVLVPLDADLQEALEAWKTAFAARMASIYRERHHRSSEYLNRVYGNGIRKRDEAGDLILRSKNGYPLSTARYHEIMQSAFIAAGLPVHQRGMSTYERCFSGHGLRKAGMSEIAQAGGTALQIMAISGHRNMSSVAHYVRDAERQHAALKAIQLRQEEKQRAAAASKTGTKDNVVGLPKRTV